MRGTGETKTILGNREYKKTNFRFFGNRGTNQFISGEQGNMYPHPMGGPQHLSAFVRKILQGLYKNDKSSNFGFIFYLDSAKQHDFYFVSDTVLNAWIRQMMVPSILKNHFRSVLLKQHKHQHNKTKMGKKTITNLHKMHKSSPNLTTYKKDQEGYINGTFFLSVDIESINFDHHLRYGSKRYKTFFMLNSAEHAAKSDEIAHPMNLRTQYHMTVSWKCKGSVTL